MSEYLHLTTPEQIISMNINYDDEKQGAIFACDDIINTCNRTTSGNVSHNIASIKLFAGIIKDFLLKLEK